MRRIRPYWATLALAAVVVVAGLLYATGRLQLRWDAETARDEHGHAHGGENAEPGEDEGRVRGDKAILDAEAVKAAGLTSAPARTGSIAVSVEAMGEIQVPDERVAHVTPRVSGVVREVHKTRGDIVAAGTPLAVIESAELGDARAAYDAAVTDLKVAEANVAAWRRRSKGEGAAPGGPLGGLELDQAFAEREAAETERALAERSFARIRGLQERGLRSRTELLAAEAELAKARARAEAAQRRVTVVGVASDTELARAQQRLAAAQAKLRALGADGAAPGSGGARVVVRSPLAGIVTARDLSIGQTVEASARIFSVADPSEVWVIAALPDRDAAAVRPGQAARVRAQGVGEALLQGRVVQVGPQIDEKTRTLPVRVAVPNAASPGGATLRPGMFATVALEISRRADALVVPAAAIQALNGQTVVFVETALSEGASYQRRPVKVGARDADVVEVLDGLSAGDPVVVTNAYLLKSEFERSKLGHDHGH